MKYATRGHKHYLYIRIFIALILCIVMTMLVLSTVLYMNFQSIVLQQIYSNDISSLMQTSRNVSIMTNTALTLSHQIFSDLSVAKLLYYKDPEVSEIRYAMDQLTNYRLSIPFIDSVYVYNGKNDKIYINAVNSGSISREAIQQKINFDDQYIVNMLDNFKLYKRYMPVPRKLIIGFNEDAVKYYYTFLLYDAFVGEKLDSAVIVNISEDWIHKVISDDSGEKEKETFIIDRSGILVSNSKDHHMMTDISTKGYIKTILENASSPGCFIDVVNEKKSLITYTSPDTYGWIYIRVTPWEVLFSRIESMKIKTVFIGLGILLVGLVISVLVSRKLYLPIDKILLNLRRLEAEKTNNVKIFRQSFLKDIMLGREVGDKAVIRDKLNNLDFQLDVDGMFRIVLVKIDNYSDFCQEYNSKDRSLFKFGMMNIILECFSKHYKADTIDMGQENIVVLLNVPDVNDNHLSNSFEELLAAVQEAVLKHLNISLSMTVSTDEETVGSIGFLYKQVIESSLHRLFYGHGSIIYAADIIKLQTKEYHYPFQKEKQMTDALMAQKVEEAKKLYNEMVYGTREHAFAVINLTISRLVFAVNDVVNIIKKNNSLLSDFECNLPFSLINNAETIEDINQQFYTLFEGLSKKLEEKKNSKHLEIISKIDEIICNEYGDPGLSIDMIAESLKMSPTYICRLYKQYTLSTILDRIMQVRMKTARKLLLETQEPISDIAEKTGFRSSSYFYKAFKKYNGTTPNTFRRNL